MDNTKEYHCDNFGPDQVLHASSFKTSEPEGTVLICTEENQNEKPISVYSFFKEVVLQFPEHPAMLIRRKGNLQKWSYQEYFDESCIVAKAMIKLGLDRFHGVCIMGYNSPEWLLSSFGAVFAGGFSAGVYTTNSPEACFTVAENCRAQIIVVEDEVCLNKFLAVKKNLPHIKAIIQWSGKPTSPGVLSWFDFLIIGSKEDDKELQKRLSLAAVNHCCTLIYTSGTTGPPKGVMLSQDQLTWSSRRYLEIMKLRIGEECLLSYLPLSHLAAHMMDIYIAIGCAATVHFAPPDALKGSLGLALIETQPTFFGGVPRVWEKIYEKMQDVASKSGYIKQSIGSWAKSISLKYYMALQEGRELNSLDKVRLSAARSLVLNKVKKALGLTRTRILVSGGAPIAPEILEYFFSIDLPIKELYGMSESLSFCSMNAIEPKRFKIGSVGKVLPLTEVMLLPCDDLEPGVGEILMKGRNVCMGYLMMPDKTNETIDDDGWLHTGDLGSFDSNGFLYITGRSKELVITSGGENIPPVLIEEAIKRELPCISNALLVGDKRKFLTILLTLKSEVNLDTGEPLPELTEACKQWMLDKGCQAASVAEAVDMINKDEHCLLANAIQEGINCYNEHHSVSHAQRVQRWKLLSHDFSLPTGELNNTFKKKRAFILKKYAALIDEMYDNKRNDKILPSKL